MRPVHFLGSNTLKDLADSLHASIHASILTCFCPVSEQSAIGVGWEIWCFPRVVFRGVPFFSRLPVAVTVFPALA